MITSSAYDIHVEKLSDRMRLHAALSGACIAYRIIGGMAVYLQVSERDPGKARLTRDVDVAHLAPWWSRQAVMKWGGLNLSTTVPSPRAFSAMKCEISSCAPLWSSRTRTWQGPS